MRDPSKLTKEMVLKTLKKLPVVGDVVDIAETSVKLVKRAVFGENETCYRTGLERRAFRELSRGN